MAKEFHITFVQDEDYTKEGQLERIHELLIGNQDYINSNIIYNIDEEPSLCIFLKDLADENKALERLEKIIKMLLFAK